MTAHDSREALELQRALQRLQQEQQTFEQLKRQDTYWLFVRVTLAVLAMLSLVVVVGVSSYVILTSERYSPFVTEAACAALFVDVLGLIVAIRKAVLPAAPQLKLQPTTADPALKPRAAR